MILRWFNNLHVQCSVRIVHTYPSSIVVSTFPVWCLYTNPGIIMYTEEPLLPLKIIILRLFSPFILACYHSKLTFFFDLIYLFLSNSKTKNLNFKNLKIPWLYSFESWSQCLGILLLLGKNYPKKQDIQKKCQKK